jgi:hypothetical protein
LLAWLEKNRETSELPTNGEARSTGDSDVLNDLKELLIRTFVAGVRWGAASLVAWQ